MALAGKAYKATAQVFGVIVVVAVTAMLIFSGGVSLQGFLGFVGIVGLSTVGIVFLVKALGG